MIICVGAPKKNGTERACAVESRQADAPRNTSDSGAEETECVDAGKAWNVHNRMDAGVKYSHSMTSNPQDLGVVMA